MSLLDSGISHLLHLPETLERIAALTAARRQHDVHNSDDLSGDNTSEKGIGSVPVDILETANKYTFIFDVPGMSKSDIQVTLEEEKLLIVRSNGKRKRENGEEEGSKYLRMERKVAPKFARKFSLPGDADTSAIKAKCEDGVLTVTVEKLSPPEPKPKKVEVTVA